MYDDGMSNRLFGYERYVHKLFDWNSWRFPPGASVECFTEDGELWILLDVFGSLYELYSIEDVDLDEKKIVKRKIKRALREMAESLCETAEGN